MGMTNKKAQPKTTKYQVTFTLEVRDDVTGEDPEAIIEEALAMVIDDEIRAHDDSGTRCGVKFYDSHFFSVRRGED